MTKVYLIRHAEAEGNIYRRAHGQFDGQIIGRGYAQIEQLKARFLNERIDAVYSSDLSRTRTTAAAICGPRSLPLFETEGLREVNVGVWEDTAWGDIRHDYPEMSELFGGDPERWNVDGSEAFADVQRRMTDSIADIARRHEGGVAAVFSHGFAIRAFLCAAMGVASSEAYKVPYCDNTAVSLLSYDNGKLTVDFHGDNSHLQSGSSTFASQTWWREETERRSEDMRYLPYDEARDAELYDMCRIEAGGSIPSADIEYSAFLDDEPAGILTLSFSGGDDSTGRICGILIKPGFRRRGFGVQLIGQAVSECRRRRRENLLVEAPAGSPSVTYFKNRGFDVTGEAGSFRCLEKNVRNWG